MRRVQVPAEMLPRSRTEDRKVSYDGHHDIPVRVHWPSTQSPTEGWPVVVFYRGGGCMPLVCAVGNIGYWI